MKQCFQSYKYSPIGTQCRAKQVLSRKLRVLDLPLQKSHQKMSGLPRLSQRLKTCVFNEKERNGKSAETKACGPPAGGNATLLYSHTKLFRPSSVPPIRAFSSLSSLHSRRPPAHRNGSLRFQRPRFDRRSIRPNLARVPNQAMPGLGTTPSYMIQQDRPAVAVNPSAVKQTAEAGRVVEGKVPDIQEWAELR